MGIISGSGSFRGRFGDHFRVGDHFGVGIISGAVLACVASVSVEFGSKERPRNGVFGILPVRKMGREPKKERWG